MLSNLPKSNAIDVLAISRKYRCALYVRRDGTAHGREVVFEPKCRPKNFRGMKGILAMGHNIDGTIAWDLGVLGRNRALSAVVEYRHQKRNPTTHGKIQPKVGNRSRVS